MTEQLKTPEVQRRNIDNYRARVVEKGLVPVRVTIPAGIAENVRLLAFQLREEESPPHERKGEMWKDRVRRYSTTPDHNGRVQIRCYVPKKRLEEFRVVVADMRRKASAQAAE